MNWTHVSPILVIPNPLNLNSQYFTMQCNLLIRGGTVIDAAAGHHQIMDVAITGDRIVAVGESLKYQADQAIDASGLIVSPGLIDLHVHVYQHHMPISLNADELSIAGGVTTQLDAGSAGSYNFDGFRRDYIDRANTEVLGLVNLACTGLVAANLGELLDPRHSDPAGVVATIERHADVAVGVKIRAGAHIIGSGQQGWDHFLAAVAAARDSKTWLMVHIGECPMTLPEMMPHLQPGDCITHCFKGGSTTLLDENQHVFKQIKKAADDGIIFDVGHGFGSFHWDVVTACLDQELLPNTISTDLHLKNVHGPVYDMPTTMSKFLLLGLPLTQVFEMSTLAPAKVLGREAEIGTLKVGSRADVALLELNTGEFKFTDSYQQVRSGSQRLKAVGTVQSGTLAPGWTQYKR